MRPLNFFASLIFVVFVTFPALLQSYEDSLLHTLDENPTNKESLFLLGEYLVQRNPEQAELYANRLRKLTTGTADSSELSRMNNIYAASHRWQGNYTTSLAYYEKNYAYYSRNNDHENAAESAAKLGTINLYIGNNIVAQTYLLESDQIFKKMGTPRQKASSKLRLANFHLGIHQLDEGKELYEEALKEYKAINDSSGIATVSINLGSVLTDLGQFEMAETHLLNSLAYCEVFPTKRELGFAHDFLGLLRQAQGRLDEAYQEHLKALDIRLKLSSTYNLCESRLSVGKILIKLGEYRAAIAQLKQVFTYEEHHSLNQESLAHELLSEAYEKMGDYALALQEQKLFKMISDSILNTSSLEVIAQKEAQYKKKEQDARIKILSQEKELAEQRAFRSKVITYGTITIAIVFLSLLFFVFYLYLKVKRQKNELFKSLEEKRVLLKEIHHRVKNNLQIVSSLLSIQKRQVEDPVAVGALEESKNRVRSIALIHQNLYQDNDLKEIDVKFFIEKLTQDLVHAYKGENRNVSIEFDVDEVKLDIDRIIPIGFIVNELITNVLKYAFDMDQLGILKLKVKKEPDWLRLEVTDNGVGLPESFSLDTCKSLGYKLVRLFSNKLKAELTVESTKAINGTKVQLLVPYKTKKWKK